MLKKKILEGLEDSRKNKVISLEEFKKYGSKMATRKWNIEFTIKAESNIEQILLYKAQNISLLNAQSFLKGIYETVEE